MDFLHFLEEEEEEGEIVVDAIFNFFKKNNKHSLKNVLQLLANVIIVQCWLYTCEIQKGEMDIDVFAWV